jgi:glucose-1-phosphate cytidylyltransferase
MKVLILAGGLGTRFAEETEKRPKPMIEINGKPIINHIMDIYAAQGFNEFIVAAGYKSEIIIDWAKSPVANYAIKVIDTGLNSQTAERIKICLENFSDKQFFVTYGDGLGNINLIKLLEFHNAKSKIATITAVRPPARFGSLEFTNDMVTSFGEKQHSDSGWVNGGFFCVNREIVKYLSEINKSLEFDVLPKITSDKQLAAFRHEGFWQPMDTLREKIQLNELAKYTPPPWLKTEKES